MHPFEKDMELRHIQENVYKHALFNEENAYSKHTDLCAKKARVLQISMELEQEKNVVEL